MLKGLNFVINRFRQACLQQNSYIKNMQVIPKSWYQTAVTTEQELRDILIKTFPNANNIVIEDISGGCGAMFNIHVESSDFKGMSIVKQHQAITNALKEQIKLIHGLRIETKVPK